MAMQHRYSIVVSKEDIERCARDEDARAYLANELSMMVKERFTFDVMQEALSRRNWEDYGDKAAYRSYASFVDSEVTD